MARVGEAQRRQGGRPLGPPPRGPPPLPRPRIDPVDREKVYGIFHF
jgi:histone deacetylase complex subunit SAP18